MYYPQELIEEIRNQNDIVDVIGEYIPLKQKGSSYFGLCPFHNEATPSFSVNPDKQFYYCFGCGAAGNVYSFLMQLENYDFLEAVQKLADRAHISLPENDPGGQIQKKESLKKQLIALHKVAGRFYYQYLHTPNAKNALEYLQKRQISSSIQKRFGLGYAPEAKNELMKHLESEGFSLELMLKSGLVIEDKNKNGYHDRFRDRVMFPIFDISGSVIAFGGRILKDKQPKYLNSPETEIFSKSKNLYGLHFAKASKNKEIIIVEGYMDMISIYQAGYHNVVASLGTAFNKEHTKTLKKFVTDVIVLFDSDQAGTTAALRAIPVLVKEGFQVKVMQVPNGKDPDEFIKQNGAREFGKLLFNAKNYIQFEIDCIKKDYNLQDTQHKILFTTKAAEILSRLSNDIEQDIYIKEVAASSGVSKEAITREIRKRRMAEEQTFQAQAEKNRLHAYTQTSQNSYEDEKGLLEAQRDILNLILSDAAYYYKLRDSVLIEDFTDDVYQKLASIVFERYEKGLSLFPGELLNYFEQIEQQKKVTEVFAVPKRPHDIADLQRAVNEEVKRMKRAKLDTLAAEASDTDSVIRIVNEKKMLEQMHIKIIE